MKVNVGRDFQLGTLQPGKPRKGSSVFVDVPNLLTLGGKHLRINWRILMDHIVQRNLPGTALIHAGTYARNQSEGQQPSHWLDEALFRWRDSANPRRHATLVETTRHEGHKDIDSWIMSDLWMATNVYHFAEVMDYELAEYPFKMRYVLVSGDGGYLRTFRHLEGGFCGYLEYELIVYSWRDKLSSDLRDFAGKNRIRYLDDIPGVRVGGPPNAVAGTD